MEMQLLVVIDGPWNISSSLSTVPFPLLLSGVVLIPSSTVELASVISELKWDFPFQPRECSSHKNFF